MAIPIACPAELLGHMLLVRLPYLLYCVLSRLILPTATPIGGLARPRPRLPTPTHKPIRRPTLSPPRSAPTATAATPAFRPLPAAPKTCEYAPKTRPSCLSAARTPSGGSGRRETVPPFTPHQPPTARAAALHPLLGERQKPSTAFGEGSPAPARRPNHPSPTTLRTHQKPPQITSRVFWKKLLRARRRATPLPPAPRQPPPTSYHPGGPASSLALYVTTLGAPTWDRGVTEDWVGT